jgi:hypothetical protein
MAMVLPWNSIFQRVIQYSSKSIFGSRFAAAPSTSRRLCTHWGQTHSLGHTGFLCPMWRSSDSVLIPDPHLRRLPAPSTIQIGQEFRPHASGRGWTATASPGTVPSGEDQGWVTRRIQDGPRALGATGCSWRRLDV